LKKEPHGVFQVNDAQTLRDDPLFLTLVGVAPIYRFVYVKRGDIAALAFVERLRQLERASPCQELNLLM